MMGRAPWHDWRLGLCRGRTSKRAFGRVTLTLPLLSLVGCTSLCEPSGARSERPEPPSAPATATTTASAEKTSAVTVPEPSSESSHDDDKTPPPWFSGGGPGSAESRYGMVSSVEANATSAGVMMLELGGNAVDAAVAVAFALAVTHPSAGNLAGGGFMLIHVPGSPTLALDFRERAPLATTQELFDEMISRRARGPLAVGVPGSVAGLVAAHERHGTLPRETVLRPSIELAAKGHSLGTRQAKVLSWAWKHLKHDPEAARIFGRSDKNYREPKRQGDELIQPDLARTLRLISKQGHDGFYSGETAEKIERALRNGGIVTRADLSSYRVAFREPLAIEYRDVTVEVMSPSSAGGVAVVAMLAMLTKLEAHTVRMDSAEGYHLFAEVARRAHAERRFHTVDPDSVANYDAAARLARWRDPDHWLGRFPIDRNRASSSEKLHPLYAAAKKELEHTTHFSVADRNGMVVSCTMTLSAGFGAKFVVPGTGLVMNNSFAAFGTVGEDVPAPSRRMTSSMSPTIVSYRRRPVLVLGSPGGDTIPNTVVSVLRNIVDGRLPLSEAVNAPRIHHGFVPDELRYERARPIDGKGRAQLMKMGHRLSAPLQSIGDANSIMLWDGTFFGYADPREGGLAKGPSQAPAPTRTEK